MTYMNAIPWLSCSPGFCWSQPMGTSGKVWRWGGELGGAFGTLLWVLVSGSHLLTKGHIFLEWADPHQELVESLISSYNHCFSPHPLYPGVLSISVNYPLSNFSYLSVPSVFLLTLCLIESLYLSLFLCMFKSFVSLWVISYVSLSAHMMEFPHTPFISSQFMCQENSAI